MPELRDDVAQAREGMTVVFGARREVRKLDEYLHDNERVHSMIAGMYVEDEGSDKQKDEGRGLLVLTSKRVMFIKDALFSRDNHDFLFSKVDSVEWHSGLLFGELIIISTDTKVGIKGVWGSDGKRMVESIRQRLGASSASAEAAPVPSHVASFTMQERDRVPSRFAPVVPAERDLAPEPRMSGEELDTMMKHLERLAHLKDQGLLTDEEFETAKRRILS